VALPPRHHAALPATARPAELAPRIAHALEAVNVRLREAHAALPAARHGTPRADGGWSMQAVLEHMVRTNDAYLVPMRALVERLRRRTPTEPRWRATFSGRWLARSLEMRLPLPAPRRVQPGPTARPDVLDAVIASHHEIVSLMTPLLDADWTAEHMTSPLSALVRLNVGDAFVVLLRHSERHTAQIERLVRELA